MFKYRMRFVMLAAVSMLLALSTVSAKTWYLAQEQVWEPLSAQSKDTFIKANTLLSKGKFAKAARSYNKLLEGCNPESELYTAVLERQFYIAKEFLAGRKKQVLGVFKMKGYAEGEKIMERISERADLDDPNGIGTRAVKVVAESYQERGIFDGAYYKWLELFEAYGRHHKDALLAMARCKHAAYRGPEFDASDLVGRAFSENKPYDSTRGCYEEFKSQYPEDAQKLGVDEKLKQINEELAYKDFRTGQYYQRTGNKQAANLYYQMVIRNWPGTKAAAMTDEVLIRNLSRSEKIKK